MSLVESLESRRLFAAGALDASFGAGGSAVVRTNSRGYSSAATDVAVDGEGRVVVAGFYPAKDQVGVTRLNADGTVDRSFGTDGIAVVATPGQRGARSRTFEVAVDHAGRVLVLLDKRLVRLTAAGGLDRKFAPAGATLPNLADAEGLAVDARDNVLVIGTSPGKTGDRATVVRLGTKRGALDTSFAGGAYKTPVPQDATFKKPGNASGVGLRVLDDGRIVAAARLAFERYETPNPQANLPGTTFAISAFRLKADGSLDASYGKNGSAVVEERQDDVTFANVTLVAIRADGGVVTQDTLGSYDDDDPPTNNGDDGFSFISPDGRTIDRKEFLLPDAAIPDAPPSADPDADLPDPYEASVVAVQDDGRLIVTAQQGFGASVSYRLTSGRAYDPTFVPARPLQPFANVAGGRGVIDDDRLFIATPTRDAATGIYIYSSVTIAAFTL